MARRLDTFNFPPPRQKYDWASWTDSHAWEIYRGEDYSIATENMRVALHERARQEGKRVRTMIIRNSNGMEGLRFQFYISDDDEPHASKPPHKFPARRDD